MRIIFSAILFTLFFLRTGLYAQSNDGKKVREDLVRILDRNARWPMALAEKKTSAVFSLRINLSESYTITRIDVSKFFPKELIPQLTNPDIYKGINWQAIFGKNTKGGHSFIIPFVVYNPAENNATFYEYTVEDLFVYPGEVSNFVNATIMQTYALKYKPGIK
ncbi:hypothetical protein ACTJJ0_26180 [Chitinophaga sp. 22321]|uniref:Uncharacterized protein n=1 Tax=Chitinophaga hostae TaxID=2831022 RepID=A0ABS5J5U5_9BACT|nr:hypothetical protein [Chitinophaga hostae]MBS0030592.1 hypothetical protein [Chitinophaga hostae]